MGKYGDRAMNFVNHWDESVEAEGFKGFVQRRYEVGPQ